MGHPQEQPRTQSSVNDTKPASWVESSNGPLSPLRLHGRELQTKAPSSLYRGKGDEGFPSGVL